MELTLFELFLSTAVIATVSSYAVYSSKASKISTKHKPGIFSILYASVISGAAISVFVSSILAVQLPSYIYIEPNEEHYTRYALNTDIVNEYGRIFVINNSNEELYLCAMEYGGKTFDNYDECVIDIPVGAKVEAADGVNDYFRDFPESITRKVSIFGNKHVLWHIMKHRYHY